MTLLALYVAALFGSVGLVTVAGAYLVSRTGDGHEDGRRWLLGYLGGSVIWSSAYGIQILSSVEMKVFWATVVDTGTVVAVTSWFLFVLAYTGRERWLAGGRLASVLAIPTAAVVLAWTNPFHHLVWRGIDTVEVAGTTLVELETGLWFILVAVYLYGLMAVTVVLLAHRVLTSYSLQRGQAATLLLAGLVPWLGNAVYWALEDEGLVVDITPLLFAVTGLVVVVGVSRYRLLEVLPVAQHDILDGFEDAVAVVDDAGRLLYSNDEARRLFPEAAVGDQFTTLVSDGGKASGVVGTELQLRRDGARRYYDLRRSALTDGRGQVRAELLVFRDITDRKEREQSLAEYKTIFESVSDAVYVLDAEGTVRLANNSLADLLGTTRAEMVGRSATAFITADAAERAEEVIAGLLESERDHATLELVLAGTDGREIPCETHISLLPADEEHRGIVGVIRDVSERVQRQQQVAVLNRVLRHNLRNDMNVILGQLDQLAADVADDDLAADVETAREHAVDLLEVAEKARTAEDLLDRSVETVDRSLPAVIDPVVATVRADWPAATVRVETLADVRVRACSTVDVAIEALLENAVEHSDRDAPTVSVSAEVDGQTVALRIADDGPGIPESEVEVLTLGTETPLRHGSGLGLWLAHWVIRRSGGNLEVDRRDPRGSVVTVTLPLAPATT